LIVCTNWSTRTAPAAVVQAGAGNYVYYYCWDTADAAPYKNSLLRMVVQNAGGAESCPNAPPACTAAAYSGGKYGGDDLAATGIYPDAAVDPIFYTDPNTMNAVRLRYIVGNPAVSAVSAGSNGQTVTPVPVSVPFNTEIILED
jgi:hypothetical protein